MARLNPDNLIVNFHGEVPADNFSIPRKYTLTHSDMSGRLFLSIGPGYNKNQLRGLSARLMRDEALAEWRMNDGRPELHVFCHVSGGLAFGTPGWRNNILVHEMPLVLEIIRYAERALIKKMPELGKSPITVHFRSSRKKFDRAETWGILDHYRI